MGQIQLVQCLQVDVRGFFSFLIISAFLINSSKFESSAALQQGKSSLF